MKSPNIHKLPSHHIDNGFIRVKLYEKRLKKARKLWLRGEGPKPTDFGNSFGNISTFSFGGFA